MSLSFCILGSGSSGNSTLLRFDTHEGARHILLDAGLSPRMTAKRMGPLGVTLADISDIVLTHLDADHFHRGWIKGAQKHDVRIHLHRRHRTRALRELIDFSRIALFEDGFMLEGASSSSTPPIQLSCIHFAHDDLGTVGFVIEHAALRLGFATDVGRVPETLYECFRDLHALAIESNYDRDMQLSSGRPIYLKKRIMGGRGHLSNEQSIDAVCRIAYQSQLSHIALLHLSRQCNCPRLVQSLYAAKAPHLLPLLTVSNQYEPTPLLRVRVGSAPTGPLPEPLRPSQQLALF